MFKLVNRSLYASHWYVIHFHTLPASHFHYLMCIVCLHFIFLLFIPFLLFIFAWLLSTFIETHSVFVFTLSLPPPPSHPHKQPVKVKRKKSFNLSRKFPFYKSKENIVQELVESEREYQLCDRSGGGWVLFFVLSPSCFSSVSQFSSFHSPPGMVCVMAPLSSLFSLSQRDAPHAEPASSRRCGLLSGVFVRLSTGSRGVSSCVCAASRVCVCERKPSAALTHRPSNTAMLLLV